MAALVLNKNNFNLARESEKTVLLDFFAPWCGPCRTLLPIVEKIADENPDIFVAKINVDEEPELAGAFEVSVVPTLVIMKNGEEVDRIVGVKPKQAILNTLKG